MRKTVFWIIGLVAVVMMLGYSQDIADLFVALQKGAVIPLIVAVAFEAGKYVVQSVSYANAYAAVGETASWKRLLPLILSGIFLNTMAPSGGAAGLVLIVDDAKDRGISTGRATSAALVTQLALYSSFTLVMLIGFSVLSIEGELSLTFFLLGMIMVMLVAFIAGILFVCRDHPEILRKLLTSVERLVNNIMKKLKRNATKPWADSFVSQFADAAKDITKHKMALLTTVGQMIISTTCELLCFIAVGAAFGLTRIDVLIGTYVVTLLLSYVSPSPNGVGVAEATAAVVLSSFGVPVAVGTAIALVYRGFAFWGPFAIGAVLLRRTGFFSKKSASEEERAKQTGYLGALFVFVLGLVNVVFAVVQEVPANYEVLSRWFSWGNVFSRTPTVVLGIMLMLLVRGLGKRSRTTWAWTMLLLLFLAAAQLLSTRTYYVAAAIILLAVWLFWKRSEFDQPVESVNRRSMRTIAFVALGIIFGYGIVGYMLLEEDFTFAFDVPVLTWAVETLRTLVPVAGQPTPLNAHALWFQGSIRWVALLAAIWSGAAIALPRLQATYENGHAPWLRVVFGSGEHAGEVAAAAIDQAAVEAVDAAADKAAPDDASAAQQNTGQPGDAQQEGGQLRDQPK